MKVLIVSDTHGYNVNMLKAIEREKPFDMLVHCGDLSMTKEELQEFANCPVSAVAGNNDYFYNLPAYDLFELKNHTVLVVHGHRFSVDYGGSDRLLYKADEVGADIVLFGHTHVPYIDDIDGVTLINPGSLTYPRQDRHQETYAVLEIMPDGELIKEIKYL